MSKRMVLTILLSALMFPLGFEASAKLIPGAGSELPRFVTPEGKTYKLGKKPYPAGTREKWIAEGRVLARAPEGALPRGKALKGAADNRGYLPPIGDQGDLGSCVHWAGTYYTKTANMKRNQPSLDVTVASNQCSPRFTYNLTNNGEDSGGYGHEPFEVFMRYGAASLGALPYTTDYTSLPPITAFVEGLHRRGTNYVWVWDWNPGADQIAELKTFLDAGGVASCGVHVDDNLWYNWAPGDAPWVGVTCTIDDINHMVTVFGYGDGYYLVANSWGTTFGSNGFIVVDSDYFENYFSDVLYPLEGTYEPATRYAKVSIAHGRRSDIRGLSFTVNGATAWTNSPLPKDLPNGTGAFGTDARDNWLMAVDLTSASWGGVNAVTVRCSDAVSGTAGSLTNFTLRFDGVDFASTNAPVAIPDATGVAGAAWVQTAFETSAPVFHALGTQVMTAGVASAFTVGAGGYPVPALALQGATASSGYEFAAASGVLSYTPPMGDIGGQTFTFTASNVAGADTQTVAVTVMEPPPAAPGSVWASETNGTSFEASWSAVAAATGYRLDVGTNATFSAGGGSSGVLVSEGFGGGTTAPAGWTFTAIDATYTSSGNYGAGSPSLKLDATGDAVETPAFSSATNVSFWIKGNATGEGSSLRVEVLSGGTWSTLTDITALPLTGTTYSFPLDAAVTAARFTYTKSAGNLAFDDVRVDGSTSVPSFVAGYEDLAVSGTSQLVEGLGLGKAYFFRVRAVGAGGTSANSAVASVETLNVPTAPAFAAIPAQSASLGRPFTLNVASYASGYPAPAITVQSSTASGSDFSLTGGTLSYTPSATGTFEFVFAASNASGTASATTTVAVSEHTGASYGLFVGLNEYDTTYVPSDNWLSGCVPDANHIYTNTVQRGAWTASTVSKLLNSAGSKVALRQAMSNYAATAVSGDVFFYYHSSHGGQNSGTDVYLCTYDADYEDDDLAADLAKFAAGVQVVVMVDACHSGGLFKETASGTRALAAETGGVWDLAGNVTRIMEETRAARRAAGAKDLDRTLDPSEIGWITAADYNQYSWDGDTGGLFTDKVIEGWTNAAASSCDQNGDGFANFYELYQYASNVANSADYEYTQAQAANTNVLVGTMAGWIGGAPPGGLVVFSNMTAQTVVVGETLTYPVGAYTYGTNVPAVVAMSTVQFGASYADGVLTFTPVADGSYTFDFTATNANDGTASAALIVTATLAAPTLSAATDIGNDRFTMNWAAVPGAASYLVDVATADTFSSGGTGEAGMIVETPNSSLNEGWEHVNGAAVSGSGSSAYHKLVGASDPGVVTPAFSTVGYLEAAAGFSVATYGGSGANTLTVSYSLDGGGTWTAAGTDSSASSSTYVTNLSIALPAGALGQASVRVKWHCAEATTNVGLRARALAVTGAQAAGGNTLVVSGRSVVGTSFEVTELSMNTPYYYRVKAVGNTTGPLSTTGTATTTASDTAPSFAAIGGQSATLGALFTFDVAGQVSGYPAPTIALVSSTAAGADYGFAGGTLSFTPSATGTFAFVFAASNALGTAGATVDVAVASGPVLIPVVSVANLSSNSFTVNWTATTGGTNYQVQVATDTNFSSGGAGGTLLQEAFAALTDTGYPSGWTGSGASDLDYTSSPYYGAAAPALKFKATGQWLQSPAFAAGATNLQFWAFGNGGAGSAIAVSGLVGGVWTLVDTKTIAQSGATYRVTLDPQTTQLLFSFTKSVNCAFDDVVVTGGGSGGSILVDQTLAGLTRPVTGLTPSTPYFVRARAVGGDWSGIVSATTTAGGAAPDPEPIVEWTEPVIGGAGMLMHIQSVVGINYALEYTTNLLGNVWVQVDLEPGTGGAVELADPDCLGIQRFYRIVEP